jgi:preprotein translocase subunit SecD
MPPGSPAMPCYRPVGKPLTLTSAAISPVSAPGPGTTPSQYAITVAAPAADVTAVTAIVKRAYEARDALGVSVDGKLLEAPQVGKPFGGQQFEISLFSRKQAVQLHRILVPSG